LINSAKYHNQCLVCESDSLEVLELYKTSHLVKCKRCNFVFANRIPIKKELDDNYSKYSRDDYLSPVTIKRYNQILDQLEPYRKQNKILDIGCGIGYFLEVAKKRGWEVYGTEYTDEAINICKDKGIHVHQGSPNLKNYTQHQFDVLTAFEVFEHLTDPKAELGKINFLLRPEGALYCTVPNFNSVSKNILKDQWNIISYPEHLSYFTPRSLKGLLKAYNLKPKNVKTTGLSITRIKTSKNLSNQEYISSTSDDEKLRVAAEKNLVLSFAKKLINFLLTINGKGDTIKGFFVKEEN